MQSEAESDFISQRQAHCIHRSSDFTQVPLLAQGWSLLTLYCFINIASKETAKSSSVFLLKVSVVALYVRNICLLLGRNPWDYNETNFICVWKRQDNFFYPIVACSVVIAAEFSWFIIDTKHNTNEKSIKWEQEAFFFLCSHFFFLRIIFVMMQYHFQYHLFTTLRFLCPHTDILTCLFCSLHGPVFTFVVPSFFFFCE